MLQDFYETNFSINFLLITIPLWLLYFHWECCQLNVVKIIFHLNPIMVISLHKTSQVVSQYPNFITFGLCLSFIKSFPSKEKQTKRRKTRYQMTSNENYSKLFYYYFSTYIDSFPTVNF